MKYSWMVFVVSMLFIFSCSDDGNSISTGGDTISNPGDNPEWLIEKNLVFDGGPGKDGIPALVNPKLINVNEVTYLLDDDLVLGLKDGNKIIALPHKILDWHEIINIDVNELSLAITYCPLTGTGIGWNRVIDNVKTTFGVSGLLYKNNLIPYDRSTGSNWSQLRLECVNGELIGEKPETTVLPEMKWSLWKKIYANSKVVSSNTGHARPYSNYPYGRYRTDNSYFIFPIEALKNNIPSKERVHVIPVGKIAKVYRFQDFGDGKIIRDNIFGKEIILVGNQNFILSFELDPTIDNRKFTYEFNEGEVIMSDDLGNLWSIFGEAMSGPDKGQFLRTSNSSMMAYYFSVESFYEDPLIYN